MKWSSVMHNYLRSAWIGSAPHTGPVASEKESPVLDAVQSTATCEAEMGVVASPNTTQSGPSTGRQAPGADERRSARIRSWRRRVLLRRGALMHAAMGADAEHCSLAMLDEEGVVVSWRGRADGNDRDADNVVDHHVSQFYVPEDIAGRRPLLDLHAAIVTGSNTRQGWRRRPDGVAFWGTTVIHAILLRDGRLQGFSYLTRGAEGPLAQAPSAQLLELPRGEEESNAGLGVRDAAILPAWARMTRSHRCGRRRRLLRLARRMRMLDGDRAPSGA